MNFICWIGNKQIRNYTVHGINSENGISFKKLLTNQEASVVNTWLQISCFQSVPDSDLLPCHQLLQGRVKHRYRWWVHQPFLRFNKDNEANQIVFLIASSWCYSVQSLYHLKQHVPSSCAIWSGQNVTIMIDRTKVVLFGETIVVVILFWQDCHSSLVPSTKLRKNCTKKK